MHQTFYELQNQPQMLSCGSMTYPSFGISIFQSTCCWEVVFCYKEKKTYLHFTVQKNTRLWKGFRRNRCHSPRSILEYDGNVGVELLPFETSRLKTTMKLVHNVWVVERLGFFICVTLNCFSFLFVCCCIFDIRRFTQFVLMLLCVDFIHFRLEFPSVQLRLPLDRLYRLSCLMCV